MHIPNVGSGVEPRCSRVHTEAKETSNLRCQHGRRPNAGLARAVPRFPKHTADPVREISFTFYNDALYQVISLITE